MEYNEILVTLANELRPARFRHCRDVSQTAVRLAERWDADIEKARLAGILHDCARNLKGEELLKTSRQFGMIPSPLELLQPALIHAPLGAIIAERRFGISEPQVLQAIRRHTTGAPQMTLLDKVIYLSDCIEPGRNFSGVRKIRDMAVEDLDAAVLLAYEHSILFVVANGGLLHPNTVEGRNSLLMELKASRNGK
jgi:predicted HD superfamily hydrolase involved in NAD metabolism